MVEAVQRLRGAPLLAMDTNNRREFLDDVLVVSCEEHEIELTRCRPYGKNEWVWVEQKNGAVVRWLESTRGVSGAPEHGSGRARGYATTLGHAILSTWSMVSA